MKIKVKRVELIKKLQERRKAVQEEYDEQKKEYDKKLMEFRDSVVEKTETYLKQVKALKTAKDVKNSLTGSRILSLATVYPPYEPSKPQTQMLDSVLARLEMAVDDVIEVKENDDYFRYL